VLVTLAGPELAGLAVDEPAASVRLLLPPPGEALVVPAWNGNEFLLPGGRRPAIRTFTPLRVDPVGLELDVAVVLHGAGGVASPWAARAVPGDEAAVSGPGRGYRVDPSAPGHLLVGDESALPAIGQLLAALPAGVPAWVHLEVAGSGARAPLPERDAATVTWHDALPGEPPGTAMVEAVRTAAVAAGTRIWVAGEAAAVQRVRRHLFAERGLSRPLATVRGYWKHGRAGAGD
jgi:NADPH-dependent ferric siderophore reductase